MIQKMIEGFEATCYELSDGIKAKLLASDPNVARDKIMDLYAWEWDPKRPKIKPKDIIT